MTQGGLHRRNPFRGGLILLGLAIVAGAGLLLDPRRLAGVIIPLGTAGTAFNLSLLGEIRVTLLLLGLLCLGAGAMPNAADHLSRLLSGPYDRADRWLSQGRRWLGIVLASSAVAAMIYGAYSIARHQAFNSKAYDLGLHAQVFWNTSHGRLFASSVEVGNYLGDHVSPIILALVPAYWLWPDPRTLLILQAVALTAAALPLALLAKRLVATAWPSGAHVASLVLALVFLAYPALGFVNRFEFHEEVLAVPLLLAAFWFLEIGRPAWMSAMLLAALLCKEDVGLTIAAFGVFAAWRSPRQRRLGVAWALVGMVWSLAALLLIIPAIRGAPSDTLNRYAWLGANPSDIVQTLARDPAGALEHVAAEPRRLWMLVKILLPTGFLALLSPAVLIALPSVAINWLAGNLYQSSIYFHYATALIPVIFASAAYGLARAGREAEEGEGWNVTKAETVPERADRAGKRQVTPAPRDTPPSTRHSSLLLWLIGCAALALAFDQFWQPVTGPADWENYSLQRTVDPAAFAAAARLLPDDGAVATTEAFAPHLAERQGLYLLHDPRILQVADQVEWVLVDLNDTRYGVQPKLYYALLRWIAERRGLATCHFRNDVVLLGPNCANAQDDQAYRSRLRELQQAVLDAPIDVALAQRLGLHYFQP